MSKKLWSLREESLRKELRIMRKAVTLTQVELSKKLGVHQSFVSKYENGERQLRFQELELVCQACDTSLYAFSKKFSELYPSDNITLK
jgi:transcriptional regulator with XRE-family HTH domain